MDRSLKNNELIQILAKICEENPDLRFSQALSVYGFVTDADFERPKYWKNEFYTEPDKILNRVKDKLSSIKN